MKEALFEEIQKLKEITGVELIYLNKKKNNNNENIITLTIIVSHEYLGANDSDYTKIEEVIKSAKKKLFHENNRFYFSMSSLQHLCNKIKEQNSLVINNLTSCLILYDKDNYYQQICKDNNLVRRRVCE